MFIVCLFIRRGSSPTAIHAHSVVSEIQGRPSYIRQVDPMAGVGRPMTQPAVGGPHFPHSYEFHVKRRMFDKGPLVGDLVGTADDV